MTEIAKLLDMTYNEVCGFLLQKYGAVPYNYFRKDNCKSKNELNNRCRDEGLFIHHIDEDKAIMLSTPAFAIKNPYEYQFSNRLVYCNMLEHLLLHIKIVEYPNPQQNPRELCGLGGVVNFLVPELNDVYSGFDYIKQPWKQIAKLNIINLKTDYLKCIKKWLDVISNIPLPIRLFYEVPLLTSFAHPFGSWDKANNEPLYNELRKIGVKK